MEKRVCPECGEAIIGRIDKKFCSDMCRNAFNNKVNSDSNNYVRNVNNALRKNRRILEETIKGEMVTVARQKLLSKGFNFNYNTHQFVTSNNHRYIGCYEYAYFPLENDMVIIVKRKTDK